MPPAPDASPSVELGHVEAAALFARLQRDRFTGWLRLAGPESTFEGPVHAGRPVATAGTPGSVAVLVRLFAEGLIDSDAFDAAAGLVEQDGLAADVALIWLDALDGPTLDRRLCSWVEARLAACCAWPAGRYALRPEPGLAPPAEGRRVVPARVLLRGAAEALPTAEVAARFDGRMRARPRFTARLLEIGEAAQAVEGTLELAALCDGRRSLGELIAASPLPLLRTLRLMLGLEWIGAVELAAPRRDARADAEGRTTAPMRSVSAPGATSRPPAPLPAPAGAARATSRPPAPLPTSARAGRATSPPPAPQPTPARAGRATNPPPASVTAAPRRRSTGSLARPPGAEGALADDVKRRAAEGATMDAYQQLDVAPSANAEVLCAAYQRQVRRFAAHHFAQSGDAALIEAARRVVEQVMRAYDQLADPARRAAYDATHLPAPAAAGADVGRADDSFERGRRALADGRVDKALAYFELACTQDPHRPRLRAWRAWARFCSVDAWDGKGRNAAHSALLAAVAEAPDDADGHALLGQLYVAVGRWNRADACFGEALERDPGHAEALRGRQAVDRARRAGLQHPDEHDGVR